MSCRRSRPNYLVLGWLLLMASCGGGSGSSPNPPPPPPPFPPGVSLTTYASNISNPVDIQFPPDNSGRMFVVNEAGTIEIVKDGNLVSVPFLDIQSKVKFSGEMGLLGLAFHPNYSQNGRFFLNYIRPVGSSGQETVIAEYRVSADADVANPASERVLFTASQPFENHKAGQMAFGPDGFLYISLGDGGSGGDPLGNGQNLQVLLGKMLRIDVDSMDAGLQYHIPADNPFADGSGRKEIWAYGFRNPWRFSFERGTGRLFVADVGQEKWEEIDLVERGKNYGWNTMEGMHCYSPASGCSMTNLTLPIVEYDHSNNRAAVIGGYVYKGSAIPGLTDIYTMADYGSGEIWALKQNSGQWTMTRLLSSGRSITCFGQDPAGEIYLGEQGGAILKLVAQ